MTSFIKKINVDEAMTHLINQIEDYRNKQFIYNTIEPILKKFEGKSISQRLVTALKKEYPNYNFNLRCVASSLYYLEVREIENYTTISELSIFLGYTDDNNTLYNNGKAYYTMDMIKENNRWIFQINQMNNSTLNGMKLLKDRAEQWNSLLERMQAIEAEMENYNGLSTFFKFKS